MSSLLFGTVLSLLIIATIALLQNIFKPKVISQEAMIKAYHDILANAVVYVKTAIIVADQVTESTIVHTHTSSGHETTNTADPGDWIITNPGGEQYIISNEKFRNRYVKIDGNRYQACGKIKAFEYVGKSIKIETSWGSTMPVNSGDYLCTPYPTQDPINEVYRIDRKEFFETYEKLID